MKYSPKRFWGLVQSRSAKHACDVKPKQFAEFCENLFFDPSLPPDQLSDLPFGHAFEFTHKELAWVLDHRFKSNKSSGLSPLPLQLLKFMGKKGQVVLCDFLNKVIKSSTPPRSWRSIKVVPVYKGSGDSTNCDNYRAIAIMPPFAKLLMALVNRRLELQADEKGWHTET